MYTKALASGFGVLLLGAGATVGIVSADPSQGLTRTTDPVRTTAPPAPSSAPLAVASLLLARGSAGEFMVGEEGIRLGATDPTDLALVQATLAPHSATGPHEHAGPSMVVVERGTLRMVEFEHGGHGGCTEQTYGPGTAFVHPSDGHDFVNDTADPVVFYVVYFLPEGASPAPIPVDAPHDC
jgi:hypothetical protein